MISSFSAFISRRYLKEPGRLILSFTNILSLTGIFLGVFSLLVVLSVMNGFDRDIRERIVAFRSDIKISGQSGKLLSDYEPLLQKLEELDYVKSATPILSSELLIQSKQSIYGALCTGIDYNSYCRSTSLQDRMFIGSPDQESLENNGVILGFDLAMNLNVSLGEKVQLTAPTGTEITPFGLLPRSKSYTVKGLFSSGIPDYDLNYCFFPLKASQYFNGVQDEVEVIEVRSENPDKSWYYRRLLENELGSDYVVKDWSDYEANLFNAIMMEKILMLLVLSLIIILAGFNMAGNLNRLVTAKKRDIGILQAIGVKKSRIRQIFLLSSFYITVTGIALGLAAALIFLLAQLKWQFITIPVSGFPIDTLPVDLRMVDFVVVSGLAMAICLLSALVPASRSKNLNTIEILREK